MPLWRFEGKLEAKDPASKASLAEYRVELLFKRKADVPPEGAGEPAPEETSVFDDSAATHSDDSGHFKLTIPDESQLVAPSARVLVAAPSGKTVGDAEVTFAQLHDSLTVRIDAPDQVQVAPADPSATAAMIHVSGQVIDPTGKALVPGIQITIVARRDGAGAGWQPILATKLDPSGKFFGDVPNEEYADAAAIVPGADATVAVPLDGGRIAKRMLLAAEFSGEDRPQDADGARSVTPPRTPTQSDIASASETYSVDLGTGRCIDFNTPNRAIEEFDFYSVVRTTEPDVRPVTLPDVDRASAPMPMIIAGGNGADQLTAVRYDVQLESRELADPGDIRISFVTDQGDRVVVAEHAAAAARGATTLGGGRAGRAIMLENRGAADVDLSTARVNRQAWSVTDERDSEAIGLDLHSIRSVEVEPVEGDSKEPLALVRIGITATTETGDQVPILIAGAPVYSGQPWIQVLRNSDGDAQPWDAPAEVGDGGTPVVRRFAAKAGSSGISNHVATNGERWQQIRESMFAPALTRTRLTWDNPVDWDSTPTLYEAATVAHGHLLHFKQVWYADGYSLGDLLYSLPLAPGQKKLVSVVDWERRETTARNEVTTGREGLEAFSARDRDLGEVVTGALTESVKG